MIWEAKLDGRYHCFVQRKTDSTGTLKVLDGEKVLLEKEVRLSYGALFGPDIDDVVYWEDLCIEVIDEQLPS